MNNFRCDNKTSAYDKSESPRRLVTVLMPAYNEGPTLPLLLAQLTALADAGPEESGITASYDWEFLVVDDGSTDNTLAVLAEERQRDDRVHYVSLSRNFGKENALTAGLDYARGDCVVIMDADMQHPMSVISEMLRKWEEGYDDVYGQRLSRGKESPLRRTLTKIYYRLLRQTTSLDVLPDVGDFRLLDRRCVDALRTIREVHRCSKGLCSWIGFRKAAVNFHTADRREGSSHFTMRKLLRCALEGITGFTTAPLKFATILGLIVSAAAFIYIIVILSKTLIWGEEVQGFPTLMCVILFLGGCQLLALGIIGEYMARIFNETKSRPLYIADSYDGLRISQTDRLSSSK